MIDGKDRRIKSGFGRKMNQKEVWSTIQGLDQSCYDTALNDPDYRIRLHTAERIGVIRDKRQVRNLIVCLEWEDDPEVISAIVRALDRIGKPAIPPLIRGLKDEKANVRWASAKGLGGIACIGAISNLCEATEDTSPVVRLAAVQALGSIGILNKAVEAKIQTCLGDDDERVVMNAVYSAGRLGCNAAVPHLISLLATAGHYPKQWIIEKLGDIGDNRATLPLVNLLIMNDSQDSSGIKTDDIKIAGKIIYALGQIADPRGVQPLIDALVYWTTVESDNQGCNAETGWHSGDEGTDPAHLLGYISEALVRIGEPAIPSLIGTLREWAEREEGTTDPADEEDDEDCNECSCFSTSVTSEITIILTDFGPLGIEAVLPLLSDEKVSVRKLAARFFSKEHLDDKRVRDALITCMIHDSDEGVKTLAAHSLSGGGALSFEEIVSAVDQLHRPFTGPEQEAIRLIASEAVSNLTEVLEEPDELLRQQILDSIRNLLESKPYLSGMAGLGALFG